MSDPSEPSLEPAESRAVELLRLVGSQTPAVSSRFTDRLVERARRAAAPSPCPLRAHRRPGGGDRLRARRTPSAAAREEPRLMNRHRHRPRRGPARRLPPAPRGCAVLLVVGLLCGDRAGADHAARAGAGGARPLRRTLRHQPAAGQAGLGDSLAALVGTAVRLTIVVIATFAALTLLGLGLLSDSLNEGIVYIPRLLARSRSCWSASCSAPSCARGSTAARRSSISRCRSGRWSRCWSSSCSASAPRRRPASAWRR